MNGPVGIANGLVLYDWVGELDQAQWFDIALQFFFEAGAQANQSHVRKEDARKPSRLKPKTAEKRLAAGDRYKSISIESTRPPHDNVEQWTVSASFGLWSRGRKAMSFIYDSRELGLEYGLLADLVQRVATLVHPAYGFGFQRHFAHGPGWYVHDFIYGLDERLPEHKAEIARIGLWADERGRNKAMPNRHLQGLQRDVFPFNVLTSLHLSQAVEGIALEQWIRADSARGHLNPIASDIWGWTVPVSSLSDMRTSLQAANLLITRPAYSP